MKRKAFLAWLFGGIGISRAQQWNQCVPANEVGGNMIICSDKMKPALNNQCPVCATMAEPLKWPECLDFENSTPTADGNIAVPKIPCSTSVTSRMTRCIRCNAAFWQDAEK